jgi:hydroxymethylglutaryl-CoA lyase/(R)-citramalyl-CoA lyase
MVAAGAGEISLADTIGVATPTQVGRLVGDVAALGVPVGVHLHDTRNTAIANAWSALQAGATVVDAATGGTGGCPFAPNATGNLATEDLLYLLEAEGLRTGIDLDAVIATAHWLGERLGRDLPGRVSHAGRFRAQKEVTSA